MARPREKIFYKIGEVCEQCELEPHVLRYWESEFPLLRPAKNRAGQRIYRKNDIQLIEQIKHLLYERGFTIAGARQKLDEDGYGGKEGIPLFEGVAQADQKRLLREIRREVDKILELLEGE